MANQSVEFIFNSCLVDGLVMSISLFQNPDQYSAWLWIDLFVVPISTIFYLISWQLFTWLFVLKIVSENPFVKLEDGACIVKALIGMNERSLGEFGNHFFFSFFTVFKTISNVFWSDIPYAKISFIEASLNEVQG